MEPQAPIPIKSLSLTALLSSILPEATEFFYWSSGCPSQHLPPGIQISLWLLLSPGSIRGCPGKLELTAGNCSHRFPIAPLNQPGLNCTKRADSSQIPAILSHGGLQKSACFHKFQSQWIFKPRRHPRAQGRTSTRGCAPSASRPSCNSQGLLLTRIPGSSEDKGNAFNTGKITRGRNFSLRKISGRTWLWEALGYLILDSLMTRIS